MSKERDPSFLILGDVALILHAGQIRSLPRKRRRRVRIRIGPSPRATLFPYGRAGNLAADLPMLLVISHYTAWAGTDSDEYRKVAIRRTNTRGPRRCRRRQP